MDYWIFKVSPNIYDIDRRLLDADPNTTWQVTRYKDRIHRGDLAFIWRAGEPRGLCAIMQIDSEPEEMEEIPVECPYYVIPDFEPRLRVRGRFTRRFRLISSKELREIPGLENLSVFHGFQMGTNFPVSQAEGEILLRVIEFQEDC